MGIVEQNYRIHSINYKLTVCKCVRVDKFNKVSKNAYKNQNIFQKPDDVYYCL